ncbi:MAG: Coq4 family protein [Cyanobacteria bacterium J06638_7]
MRVDPDLRRKALRSALALLETARNPETVVVHGVPVVETIDRSPLGEITRRHLLADSQLREFAAQRYQGEWPRPEAMRAMPPGSLGRLFQERFDRLGLHRLPALALDDEQDDGAYLQKRRLATHDVHHTVLALPVSVAGEAAGAAYYSAALNEFGTGAILLAWMFHAMENPSERERIWKGVRFGLDLAECLGTRLLAMRWEEGWSEPIGSWRERLGIADLLQATPFPEELALLS